MSKDAVLGPLAHRKKVDLRLPVGLTLRVGEVAEAVGVPRNAMYALAAALLTVQLIPMVQPGKKRAQLLKEMRELVHKILGEIEKLV